MIQKVDKERLYIIGEDDIDQAVKNAKMEFALTDIMQMVVDRQGHMTGIISEKSEAILRERGIRGCMDTNFVAITDTGRGNTEHIADKIFQNEELYIVPVLDTEDKIRYAYSRCNSNTEVYRKRANSRFSFQSVLDLAELYQKDAAGQVYIYSDLGEADNSVCLEDIPNLADDSLVVIDCKEDYDAWSMVKACISHNIKFKTYAQQDLNPKLADYFNVDRYANRTLEELSQENGKYFDSYDFEVIFQAIRQTKNLKGAYVEIGTYRGDSAKAALQYMKNADISKQCYFLDTYEGFNYTSAENSSDALWKGSHTDTSVALVQQRLEGFQNAKCIKANIIEDELPEEIGDIAVCNIDVDMYEAIYAALEKVKGHMLSGGIILAEDFGHTPNLIGGSTQLYSF